MIPRLSPCVKILLCSSVVIFLLQLAFEKFMGISLAYVFGFVPAKLADGWVWQLFTYSLLHSGLFHILFNLLILWMIGSELESLWGWRTFVAFYLVCTVGAAITHGIFSIAGLGHGIHSPVIGLSGVVYGLLMAYGILFGDRMMYFFMIFPMQARYFVLILGGIELVSSVFYSNSGVAHLAHLGGMAFGFLFLVSMASWKKRSRGGSSPRKKRKSNHLRLVGDEEEDEPRHWN
ncbi:MAG: rhomboid family intramembrane serine protease [Oligoflexia bacterium]|nr:rhomboid family intramembrane serine protease [Oligoflexia bacterium]